MAGRSDIQAGRAFVEIYVKNSLLVQGLNQAKAQLQNLGRNIMSIGGMLTGMGAAIVSPLVAAVGQFTKIGSELADVSARTGMAADSLAELKFAAEQGGAGLSDVEAAIRRMQKSGSNETFDEAAARIAAIEDPAKRAQAAIETWGKSGTKLLPMLQNLEALRQEARDLGLAPSNAAVEMADQLGDSFDAVRSVVRAIVFNVGSALAPAILPALTTVKAIAVAVNNWVKNNGELIRSVFLIGGGILAAGAAITAIGGLIFGLGSAFGVVAGAITTVAGVLGGLMSPAALITAAILGGVYAWLRFTDSGKAALASLTAFVAPFVETIRTMLGGIGDALSGGNLQLAGQIAVTGLQLLFTQAIDSITGMIGGTLGAALGDIGTRVIQGDLAGAWQTAVAGMGQLWAGFCQGIVKTFTAAAGAVLKAWQGTVKTIATGLLDASAQGGVTGKIASAILGVDLEAEKRKSDSLDRQAGRVPGSSFMDAAHAAAGQGVDAMAAPIDDFLQGLTQTVEAQADAANKALADQLGSGDGPSETVQRLQEQLAELRKQAAEAAAQAKQGGGGNRGPDLSGLGEIKNQVSVGFSAAGLLAAAGGPQERMARGIDKLVLQTQRTNELLERDEDLEVDA